MVYGRHRVRGMNIAMQGDTQQQNFWKLRPNAPQSGHILGVAEHIADGTAHEFMVGKGRSAFRLFVVRRGAQFHAYLNLCPHYSLPLNHQPNQFLSGGFIECAQHFARFEIEDGLCISGACEGEALTAIAVFVNEAGELVVA